MSAPFQSLPGVPVRDEQRQYVCLGTGVNVQKQPTCLQTASMLPAREHRERISLSKCEWSTTATRHATHQLYTDGTDRRCDEPHNVVRFTAIHRLVEKATSIRSRPRSLCAHCGSPFGAFSPCLMALAASTLNASVRPDMLSLKSPRSVYIASLGRASISWRRGNSNYKSSPHLPCEPCCGETLDAPISCFIALAHHMRGFPACLDAPLV